MLRGLRNWAGAFVAGGVALAGVLAPAVAALALAQEQTSARPPVVSAAADFANLAHYAGANAKVGTAARPGHRVVFLGDSITEYWGKNAGKWFASPEWFNRGISGQTTSQILLREQADVIALHPDAVVLEGGSNDIRYGFSAEAVRDNVASMAEIAAANHIQVFIALVTPVCDCFRPLTEGRTPERVRQQNRLYEQLCSKNKWTCLDYYSPMADAEGHMRKELTLEGVHPNDAGYALLTPVVLEKLAAFR